MVKIIKIKVGNIFHPSDKVNVITNLREVNLSKKKTSLVMCAFFSQSSLGIYIVIVGLR